jgi:hypothetical protein
LRCSGPSASPRPVTNPELIGKLQSCIREDFLAQLKKNGAEREHSDKAVKTDREGAQKNEVSAEKEGRNHEGKHNEDQDDQKKDKQGHDLHGKEHARPTVEPSEDTVLELEKDEPQAPEVDGKTAGLSCPGSVRYGYDKLKAQGGCSAKENSTIGAFEEFAVVYHWVRIREGIECSFTLKSPTHVYTLQVRALSASLVGCSNVACCSALLRRPASHQSASSGRWTTSTGRILSLISRRVTRSTLSNVASAERINWTSTRTLGKAAWA